MIRKTTITVHYTTETMSKITVTQMNYEGAGFHNSYKTINLKV